MARYDYQCKECEHIEEHIHSMKEKPKIKCSKCKGKMESIITGGLAGYVDKIFVGDLWDKCDVDIRDPQYARKAMEHNFRKGRILQTPEQIAKKKREKK